MDVLLSIGIFAGFCIFLGWLTAHLLRLVDAIFEQTFKVFRKALGRHRKPQPVGAPPNAPPLPSGAKIERSGRAFDSALGTQPKATPTAETRSVGLYRVPLGSIRIASRIETGALRAILTKYNRIVFLDVETTGLSAEQDRVIEIATLEVTCDIAAQWIAHQSQIDAVPEVLRFNPLQLIPQDAVRVHGITNEMAAMYPPMDPSFVTGLLSRFGPSTLIVGHNVSYDIRMLQGETVRILGNQNGWQNGQRHICTMSRFRRLFPNRSRKLDACLSTLGIGGRSGAIHGAGEDVLLTALLFSRLGGLETVS